MATFASILNKCKKIHRTQPSYGQDSHILQGPYHHTVQCTWTPSKGRVKKGHSLCTYASKNITNGTKKKDTSLFLFKTTLKTEIKMEKIGEELEC